MAIVPFLIIENCFEKLVRILSASMVTTGYLRLPIRYVDTQEFQTYFEQNGLRLPIITLDYQLHKRLRILRTLGIRYTKNAVSIDKFRKYADKRLLSKKLIRPQFPKPLNLLLLNVGMITSNYL
jgi:hypothetical protein